MNDCWYDRQGRPISPHEAIGMWRRPSDRVVCKTRIAGECVVSTVWLGLDHGFGKGAPLIFETLVFGGPRADECWRYATEERARAGHAQEVQACLVAYHAAFADPLVEEWTSESDWL